MTKFIYDLRIKIKKEFYRRNIKSQLIKLNNPSNKLDI